MADRSTLVDGVVPRGASLSWSGTEIPSLYGLRGIAAMVVVLAHLGGIPIFNGNYAVICFFVLSGFLITYLLLAEFDKTGKISLGRFYQRRALRIFPAFYGYALCYVAGRLILRMSIDWPSLVSCLTYTSNYYFAFSGRTPDTMVHTWSLAVEEQFYLLWPFLLWRFGARRSGVMKFLLWAVLAVWGYRWIATALDFNGNYVFDAFETRADALAIGCLLAVANRHNCLPRWLVDYKWPGPVAAALMCFCAFVPLNGPRYMWALMALLFAVLMIQSIAHANSRWYRFLGSPPLHALGVISYSLYLYHPFAIRLSGALHTLPIGIAAAIGLATASYWIVEKPFLSIKDRLSARARASSSLGQNQH